MLKIKKHLQDRLFLVDTVGIVSFLSSRHKRSTVGAIICADTTGLPTPRLRVVVTDFLRQSEPEGWGMLVSKI